MEGGGSLETIAAKQDASAGGTPAAPTPTTPPAQANLVELWHQILAGLELPSTRMLLSQQATLHRLDERRAVVRVAGNWIAMVQSRLPLLERAMAKTLGSSRQVTLEASEQRESPAVPADTAVPNLPVQPLQPGTPPTPEPSPPGTETNRPSEALAVLALPVLPAAVLPTAVLPATVLPLPVLNVEAEPGAARGIQATVNHASSAAGAARSETQSENSAIPGPPQGRQQPTRLDESTQRFADFFNGEVIALEPDPNT